MSYSKGMLQVVGLGRITADPERTELQTGAVKTDFRIAVNDGYRKADGTDVEHTSYCPVVAWGKLAENIAQWVVKGQELIVLGDLVQDQWQNEAGENRSKLYIKARSVQFGSKPGEGKGGGDESGEWTQPESAGTTPAPKAPPIEGEVPF